MLEVLKESSCDYKTFVAEITDAVREMMGEEYSAKLYRVTKNNSLELDSLVLLKEGKSFAPNIYLLPYYEAYQGGISTGELAQRLCTMYRSFTAPITAEKFNFTFEEVKYKIIYRLVSYDKNQKLLEKIPHQKYLDLAITFHCLVHNEADGIGTIRITNEHMDMWNTSVEEMIKLAVNNTRKRFPPVIRSMQEVMKSMLSQEFGEENDFSEELMEKVFDHSNDSKNHKMYILSNPKGINGATCLLYDNILKKFSDQIRSNFYILPSSIHEVILVPDFQGLLKEELIQMVKDVNCTQVASDEVLSDKVYYYSRENNAILV